MEGSALLSVGLMIIVASALAIVAKRLKQPLIFGYVLAGILLSLTGVISDPGPIIWLSELALIFLMFVIGLQLDLTRLKEVGRISVLLGALQVGAVLVLGGLAAWSIGLSPIASIYVGLVLAFSSTLLVAKLLEEQRETTSLIGELTMGILIVQDIFAVLALALLGALSEGGIDTSQVLGVFTTMGMEHVHPAVLSGITILFHGILFVVIAYLFFKYVMPHIFASVVGSNELLFISSLAIVFLFAALADVLDFSLAIGSFAAGIALSSATYSHEVVSRVKPLKDFFLTLFFVLLGLQVTIGALSWPLLIVCLAGALIIKPALTFLVFKFLRYNNYTAFLSSLNLAQLGEFGLILVANGVLIGVLSQGILSTVVLATILTMMLSAWIIKHGNGLYDVVKPMLAPLEKAFKTHPEDLRNVPDRYRPAVVIFGSTSLTDEIVESNKDEKLLVIDYNPQRAEELEHEGVPVICSDAIDIDLYESVDFSKARLIVSIIHDTPDTLHGPSSNVFLIKKIRSINKEAVIIVTAKGERDAERYYLAGATIVLTPQLMGRRLLREITSERDLNKLRGMGLIFYEELHPASIKGDLARKP